MDNFRCSRHGLGRDSGGSGSDLVSRPPGLTARADNPASSEQAAEAARQGEADSRIKSALCGGKRHIPKSSGFFPASGEKRRQCSLLSCSGFPSFPQMRAPMPPAGKSGKGRVPYVFAFDHENDHFRHIGGMIGNTFQILGDIVQPERTADR